MPIYDISLSISESLVVWPKDPPVMIAQPRHFDKYACPFASRASRRNVSRTFGVHLLGRS